MRKASSDAAAREITRALQYNAKRNENTPTHHDKVDYKITALLQTLALLFSMATIKDTPCL
jgi:hypothetical protein